MNKDKFIEVFITEKEDNIVNDKIDEYNKELIELNKIVRRRKLLEVFLVRLLSERPRRKDGKWIVNTYLDFSKDKDKKILIGTDLEDFEYMKEFFKCIDIEFSVSNYDYSSSVSIYINVELSERDELEEYIISNNEMSIQKLLKLQ